MGVLWGFARGTMMITLAEKSATGKALSRALGRTVTHAGSCGIGQDGSRPAPLANSQRHGRFLTNLGTRVDGQAIFH